MQRKYVICVVKQQNNLSRLHNKKETQFPPSCNNNFNTTFTRWQSGGGGGAQQGQKILKIIIIPGVYFLLGISPASEY
jgi:hypothetical protein